MNSNNATENNISNEPPCVLNLHQGQLVFLFCDAIVVRGQRTYTVLHETREIHGRYTGDTRDTPRSNTFSRSTRPRSGLTRVGYQSRLLLSVHLRSVHESASRSSSASSVTKKLDGNRSDVAFTEYISRVY